MEDYGEAWRPCPSETKEALAKRRQMVGLLLELMFTPLESVERFTETGR